MKLKIFLASFIIIILIIIAIFYVHALNKPIDKKTGILLDSKLNGINEIPPTNSSANGRGIFILYPEDNEIYFSISYTLEGEKETGVHIHGFANENQNADWLFNLPPENPKIGVWNYDENYEERILSGLTYLNIHSDKYPSGEIRGQIKVLPEVCEFEYLFFRFS
jgi:hypothetical protein